MVRDLEPAWASQQLYYYIVYISWMNAIYITHSKLYSLHMSPLSFMLSTTKDLWACKHTKLQLYNNIIMNIGHGCMTKQTHTFLQRVTLHMCAYFESSNAKYNSQEQQLATRKRPELHRDKPSLCLSKSTNCY